VLNSLYSCRFTLNLYLVISENEAPRERPRLNLAPRSKPVEGEPDQARGEEEDRDRPAPSAPSGVSNASIFGGAKPVDTLARELEIEERNAKERAAR
jgi:translation initiation factor 4B